MSTVPTDAAAPPKADTDQVVLPSMAFATPFSLQPDSKRVFMTTGGKLVRPHGECSSTICY
jgi:hypothetical protein